MDTEKFSYFAERKVANGDRRAKKSNSSDAVKGLRLLPYRFTDRTK